MDQFTSDEWKNRLRQERIGRNWRQQDLADQLGTTVVTVKRWERGSQQPGVYFRHKLCALFGKSAEELGLLQPYLQPAIHPETKGSTSAEMVAPSSYVQEAALYEQAELLFLQALHVEAQGKNQAATCLYQQALKVWEQVLGLAHQHTIEICTQYHRLLQSMSAGQEADPMEMVKAE